MGKLGFLAGMAAGYVLGARAGKQRYAQIKTVSGKVWNSQPVQKQVASAKEAARTKAAPVVADLVGDAAKTTAARLRAQRTVRPSRWHIGLGSVVDEGPALGLQPAGQFLGIDLVAGAAQGHEGDRALGTAHGGHVVTLVASGASATHGTVLP